jgi:DNA-binding FadR family transcriptional regulator
MIPQQGSTGAAAATSATASTDSSQSTFRSDLSGLLSAVQSGDPTASETAADTLIALNGLNSQSSATDGDSTTSAGTSTYSSQSAFLSNLNQLLTTVQSGDATASKTAADTLINNIKNASAFKNATYARFQW